MKNISLKAMLLNVALLGSAVALPGNFCPSDEALRSVLPRYSDQLAQKANFSISLQSKDGQTRKWNVYNPQMYTTTLTPLGNIGNIHVQDVNVQEGLDKTLAEIIANNRIVIDYDLATISQEQIDRMKNTDYAFRSQNKSWCKVQFAHEGGGTNALVMLLKQD